MPDDKVLPVLTETQKKVWRDTSKGNIRFGFYPSFLHGIELDEEVWDDVRPAKNPGRIDDKDPAKGKGTGKPGEK